jgi:hypothetical protein
MNDLEREASARSLQVEGWAHLPAAFPQQLVAAVTRDLTSAYAQCRDIQTANGLERIVEGTAHHLPCFARTFLDLLDRISFAEIFEAYFGGPFILNSYGAVINLPDQPSYVSNIHRDIRTFSGSLPLMLNMLVMLDPFTVENGATYLLPGSHLCAERPKDEEFYAKAARAVGTAGDVVLWNSNLWHAAGRNTTATARRALTLTWTKPFIKQQLDYPRALGYDVVATLSDRLKQFLGYYARVPATIDEWYQPPEKRMYRPGQG